MKKRHVKNLKKSANKFKENKKFNIIIYKQTLYFMKCSLLSFILEQCFFNSKYFSLLLLSANSENEENKESWDENLNVEEDLNKLLKSINFGGDENNNQDEANQEIPEHSPAEDDLEGKVAFSFIFHLHIFLFLI